jgi:hypothetical protein
MTLADYLGGMRSATTAEELDAAIQAPFKHPYRGRTWSQICRVRIEVGERIVASHSHGFYVPHLGERRLLTVCGQTYKVGRGQNSTGIRYAWHYAGDWAKVVLSKNGFSKRAANRLWDSDWQDYPHRALGVVASALAGQIPDPPLNVLIKNKRYGCGHPINYSVEQNEADQWDRRACRPCNCGGTLFDWGGGHSEGFDFISWRCNACPDTFTEYMTREAFYSLRQGAREG